ncbi:DNA polymerase Y family protein, partial [Vibrio parahaemolyticus]|nr:DNA polymerase Y family protein [Vibrio parahaemolyticus]
ASLSLESLTLNGAGVGLTLKGVRQGEPLCAARDLFSGPKGQRNALELHSILQAQLGTSAVLKPDLACDPRPQTDSQ